MTLRRARRDDLPALVALLRDDAHRFYERVGFVRSHAGFKLDIRP